MRQKTTKSSKKGVRRPEPALSMEILKASRFTDPDVQKVLVGTLKMGPQHRTVFFEFLLELFKTMEERGFDEGFRGINRGFLGFGKKIRSIRKFLGLTLEEFAVIVRAQPSQVSMIETGKRRASIETLMRVCMAFHMKPERLLSDWDD